MIFSNLTIVLIICAFALLAVMFIVGQLSRLDRSGAIQGDIETLQKMRDEEVLRFDTLIKEQIKEKENLLQSGLRAQESIDRWEAIKSDHKALEKMQQELEDFNRHESNRIDELERRRTEVANRLRDVQALLDQYPSAILDDDENWKKIFDERKLAFDQLENETKETEAKLNDIEAGFKLRQSELLELENKLEQTSMSLQERTRELRETNDAIEDAERMLKTKEMVSDATIQFPDGSLKVEITDVKKSSSKEHDKLSAFRTLPECLKDFESPLDAKDNEVGLLTEFEDALSKAGLEYHDRIIKAFHTSLKVNDLSPLTVLSGLSGTGKSQLPRAYSRFFGINFLHVPVEPGWDSPQDILGFYDFVAERYRPTDRARALGHFDLLFAKETGINGNYDWSKRMLIILLDEMNLARTEYYFSEFLSRLEMRGPRKVSPTNEGNRIDAQIAIDLPYGEEESPMHLQIPHNVLWVGTLNEDESTQTLSDKVLDRANSIRFAPPGPDTLKNHSKAPATTIQKSVGYLPYEHWLGWSDQRQDDENDIKDILEKLAILMQEAGRGFGFRIAQSIQAYIDRYPEKDWRNPMIDQINMRLLPKLSGTEMADCQNTLNGLKVLCENELGDAGFAKALGKAETESQKTQTFNWPGYTYE